MERRPVSPFSLMKNNIKVLLSLATLAGVLFLVIAWLFFPSAISYFGNIWRLLGEPQILGRLAVLLVFLGIVLFLSTRLLKKGPI